MQVGKQISYALEVFRLSGKEAWLLAEIGMDWGSTATSFVDYVCSAYDISRSGVWYCLKKLQKEGVVEFTEKGEGYKPLRMTEQGLEAFRVYMCEVRKHEQIQKKRCSAAAPV
jgi:DNA-binding PadR family transcriptional regulator